MYIKPTRDELEEMLAELRSWKKPSKESVRIGVEQLRSSLCDARQPARDVGMSDEQINNCAIDILEAILSSPQPNEKNKLNNENKTLH